MRSLAYVSRAFHAPGRIDQSVGTSRRHSDVPNKSARYTTPHAIQPVTDAKCQCRPSPRWSRPGNAIQGDSGVISSSAVQSASSGIRFFVKRIHSLPGAQSSFQ